MNIHIIFLVNSLSVILFLDELELFCLYSRIATVSTQLNGFSYCYLTPIILLNTILSIARSQIVPKYNSIYVHS